MHTKREKHSAQILFQNKDSKIEDFFLCIFVKWITEVKINNAVYNKILGLVKTNIIIIIFFYFLLYMRYYI